jgi:hypothetical protein
MAVASELASTLANKPNEACRLAHGRASWWFVSMAKAVPGVGRGGASSCCSGEFDSASLRLRLRLRLAKILRAAETACVARPSARRASGSGWCASKRDSQGFNDGMSGHGL